MPSIITRHTKAKFNTGDKVRFNGRVPQFATKDLRRRTRTIVDAFYDPDHQCSYYQLGDRGKAELGYWFRAYMLIAVNGNQHKIGRPRKKRNYKVNRKLRLASPGQNLGGVIAYRVVYH